MRKRRTRQHFIEDLGFNYVEKQALFGRCTMQRITFDYGLDAEIRTFSNNGEPEVGLILVQIKSTDKIKLSSKQNGYVFDLSKQDLEYWLEEIVPVLLVVYDAKNDVGYFINLQEYFRQKELLLEKINKFIRVYITKDNKFTSQVVINTRKLKNQIYGNFTDI
ncbi:MAG: DUF4365 domain-containing protein [Bacteroidota bacterium]